MQGGFGQDIFSGPATIRWPRDAGAGPGRDAGYRGQGPGKRVRIEDLLDLLAARSRWASNPASWFASWEAFDWAQPQQLVIVDRKRLQPHQQLAFDKVVALLQ